MQDVITVALSNLEATNQLKLLTALLFSAVALLGLLLSMAVVNLYTKAILAFSNWLKQRQRKDDKPYVNDHKEPLPTIVVTSNPTGDNWVKDYFDQVFNPPIVEWRKDLVAEFKIDPLDIKADELIAKYHADTEAYDRTVCTGPIVEDGIMPATSEERALIGANARNLWRKMRSEAAELGITERRILDAQMRYFNHTRYLNSRR